MRSLFLLSVLLSAADCRKCDCAQYSPRAINQTTESVEWFNGFLRDLYEINSDYLYGLLVETVNTELADVLPAVVRSLTLNYFEITDVPAIDLVSHSVTTVFCDDVKFKRYVLDMDMSVNNTGILAAARAKFILGLSASITVEDVKIDAILRLEILISSDVKLPAMQSIKMFFLNRPNVEFNVELGDMIGLDTFGIADWLHDMVEDAIQEKLVYPGMWYIDMVGNNTQMVDNDARLHPAVLSANITVTPLYVTGHKTNLEGWVDFGDEETKRTVLSSRSGNYKFDIFLENFKYSSARVRVIERNVVYNDIDWIDVHVDFPTELRSGSLRNSYSTVYVDGKSSWNVTVDVWAMLLPSVKIIKQYDGTSGLVPSLYTQTNCTGSSGDQGVLYIALYGAANLTISDGDVDPYVEIYLDGKKIGKTETMWNTKDPEYDFVYETLIRDTGRKRLTDHVVEFRVYDWDRWSGNDHIGRARVVVDRTLRVKEAVTVFKYGKDQGKLLVSVLFRPVPFF